MAQKLHRFRAGSFEEALTKMQRNLGQDAVVVRSAQIKEGGLFGIFGRTLVELTAAAPEQRPMPNIRTPRKLSAVERKYTGDTIGSDAAVQQTVSYYKDLVTAAQKRMSAPGPAEKEPRPAITPLPAARPSRQVPAAHGNAAVAPAAQPRGVQKAATADDDLRRQIHEIQSTLAVLVAETPGAGIPAEFAPYYRKLVARGVSRKAAATLLTRTLRGADPEVMRHARVLCERLKVEIQRQIRVTGGIGLSAGERRVVAFVGATGVGKTTNLAKLAALYAVRHRANVALITADTYRVAAPEQLRVYASIIGVPLHVVNDAKEMSQALRRFSDYDLVLIDTAGTSPFNARQLEEVHELLAAARPDETMLLLAANAQLDDLGQVVAGFRPFEPTAIFFTKLDETRQYGPLYTISVEAGLPLSYFSVGQNVPDDVVLVQNGMVADLVIEGRKSRGQSSTDPS